MRNHVGRRRSRRAPCGRVTRMPCENDGGVDGDLNHGQRVLHVITPGDHYSPGTGSATVSVVHGLSASRPVDAPKPLVAVERGTYSDRYESADVIEYARSRWRARDRYADAALARVGLPRVRARARYRGSLAEQSRWPPVTVVGHNAVQLIPVVDDPHQAVLYAHNDLLRTYTVAEAGRALERASAIVAVSDFLADRIAARLPPSVASRVVVIRNGVDLDLFRPDPEMPSADTLRVVFVGRMIPDKGADLVIEAIAQLDRPDIDLVVIGSAGFDASQPPTAYEESLRSLAVRTPRGVTFHPFQPRPVLAGLLASAHVVVVPSRWPEPFALTVLEGMASGAAVIASDIGGIPEAAGGAATLIPPGDVRALAEALEGLAEDRSLLDRLRAASLVHARAQGWARASDEFYRLVRRLGT